MTEPQASIPQKTLRRRALFPYLFESLAREVTLTVLDFRPGERVLEVGTGTGEWFLKMATLVGPKGRAVGVDASPEAVRVAQARLQEVRYQNFEITVGDIGDLSLAPASFDAICCAFVVDRIPDSETPRALEEITRLLKPGGRLALCGLTPGERAVSRAVARGWELAFRLTPKLTGRSRPRRLLDAALGAGLTLDRRLYLEQRGLPSEVLLLRRPSGLGVIS
jgi:ubiquinone/menaquinone biosynthesis C-methylase UbiE